MGNSAIILCFFSFVIIVIHIVLLELGLVSRWLIKLSWKCDRTSWRLSVGEFILCRNRNIKCHRLPLYPNFVGLVRTSVVGDRCCSHRPSPAAEPPAAEARWGARFLDRHDTSLALSCRSPLCHLCFGRETPRATWLVQGQTRRRLRKMQSKWER